MKVFLSTIKLFFVMLLLGVSVSAKADDNALCVEADRYVQVNDYEDIIKLCNEKYVSYFSTKHNIPIVVYEALEPDEKGKHHSHRTNDFRGDLRVPLSPQIEDYTNSGYDKGHMSASSNTQEYNSISETYLLTNIVPQNPSMNRGKWKQLEGYAKYLANRYGKTKVLTFAVINKCDEPTSMIGESLITVPDAMGKAILPMHQNEFFIMPNEKPKKRFLTDYKVESLKDLHLCGVSIWK